MHCSTDYFNILCIDAYAMKRISLILIYLCPTATENDIKDMFTTVGHLIDEAKEPVIMLGNFNLPKVDWIKCISSI